MLDYTYRPKTFANTAVINYSYFEMIYDLLNGDIPIRPETIIGLSIFSEAVVLHEELVPDNIMLNTSSEDESNFLQPFLDKEVLYYNYDKKINHNTPDDIASDTVRMIHALLTEFHIRISSDI